MLTMGESKDVRVGCTSRRSLLGESYTSLGSNILQKLQRQLAPLTMLQPINTCLLFGVLRT